MFRLTTLSALPLALSFGSFDDGKCETCICAADPGSEFDAQDKHCCPTQKGFVPPTWDSVCDFMTKAQCQEECFDTNQVLVLERLAGRSIGGASEGWYCVPFVQPCKRGLTCDPEGNYCASTGALVSNMAPSLPGVLWAAEVPNSGTQFRLFSTTTLDTPNIINAVAQKTGIDSSLISLTPEGASSQQLLTYLLDVGGGGGVAAAPSNMAWTGESGVSANTNPQAKILDDAGIDLISWDWDRTANDEHTFHGSYASLKDVVRTVSPDFISLATDWCRMAGKQQGIVTFNDEPVYIAGTPYPGDGPQMISDVLNQVLGPECAQTFGISAKNCATGKAGCLGNNKNYHLQITQNHFGIYDKARIVLIDDTEKNILEANGYETAWVNPATGFRNNHLFKKSSKGLF